MTQQILVEMVGGAGYHYNVDLEIDETKTQWHPNYVHLTLSNTDELTLSMFNIVAIRFKNALPNPQEIATAKQKQEIVDSIQNEPIEDWLERQGG